MNCEVSSLSYVLLVSVTEVIADLDPNCTSLQDVRLSHKFKIIIIIIMPCFFIEPCAKFLKFILDF